MKREKMNFKIVPSIIIVFLISLTISAQNSNSKSQNWAGTIKDVIKGIDGGNKYRIILNEYPNVLFYLNQEEAIKYGLIVKKENMLNTSEAVGKKVSIDVADSWIIGLDEFKNQQEASTQNSNGKSQNWAGTIKDVIRGVEGGNKCRIILNEYPNVLFYLNEEEAIKYGLIVKKENMLNTSEAVGKKVSIDVADSWIIGLDEFRNQREASVQNSNDKSLYDNSNTQGQYENQAKMISIGKNQAVRIEQGRAVAIENVNNTSLSLVKQNSCLKIAEFNRENIEKIKSRTFVKNGNYQFPHKSEYNTPFIVITGNEGGLEATDGIPGGMGQNYVYQFINKSTIIINNQKVIFEGEANDPLTFILFADDGLVYLKGKGQVIINDTKNVTLPCIE